MANFKKQIAEDILEYQAKYTIYPHMQKDEWAFNYWILDKFFYEEEELILDKIIDYNDNGIDAYEWYSDTKELYIIQNKYYNEDTKLQINYVNNTFLLEPLAVLNNGTYTHCPELQAIYSANKDDDRFTVHLQLYVTNEQRDPKIAEAINQFNKAHSPKIFAEVYYLNDIENKWYGGSRHMEKTLTATIESVNSGTILSINNAEYNLENNIDAKYVFTPITCIYRMVKAAQDKGYALFEKNIREYLGNKGINKGIYSTLKDESERKNFFYYNNGVTMICERIGSFETGTGNANPHVGIRFTVENPQIVNGCQTVNSIFTALKEHDEEDIEEQFKDAFVMLKILQIDPTNEVQKKLSKNIVTFNNSQNSIDEKTFVANNELFQRFKNEFEAKGFLLLTKQSDKNTFTEKYKKNSEQMKLTGRSIGRRQIFGLDSLKKTSDFFIPLEKLLQVILAFKLGGLAAYTQKKDVLKPDTQTYNSVVEFIKSGNVTTDVLLNLYLLYMRAEKEKTSNSSNPTFKGATPIPFYLIDGFARYECENDIKKVNANLATTAQVVKLMKTYTLVCNLYSTSFMNQKAVDYIKMIKMEIDYNLFKEKHDQTEIMFSVI